MAPNPAPTAEVFTSADVSFPAAPAEPPCRRTARDAVARHLGRPSGNAEQMVGELTDDEVAELLAAAADRQTAREQIKAVFARAYDRRRIAHAQEAEQEMQARRRSDLARKVLERDLSLSVEQALATAAGLTDEELDKLAALDSRHGAEDEAIAIVDQARARQAATRPDHSPDGIPDLDPGHVSPATPAEAATAEPPAASLSDIPPGLDAQNGEALHRLEDNGGPSAPIEAPAPAAPAKKKAKK
jgi:hypothetical protein